MWDDFSPSLTGAGPTATVIDPDGTPNNILDTLVGGAVQVDWSFTGGLAGVLSALTFTVSLFADPVGPGVNTLVAAPQVAGTATLPAPPNPPNSYETVIPIAAGFLPEGAYRLTTLVTAVVTATGISIPLAGFVDGPIIQIRPGP